MVGKPEVSSKTIAAAALYLGAGILNPTFRKLRERMRHPQHGIGEERDDWIRAKAPIKTTPASP
jgi:hypothetical protein